MTDASLSAARPWARTVYAGLVRPDHLGTEVTLVGWVQRQRDMGGLLFVDIRDREGVVQAVFSPERPELLEAARKLRPEYVIGLKGLVRRRAAGAANTELGTGEVEVEVREIKVFNTAKVPPFQVADPVQASEDLRMKYRYIDLRRPSKQRQLRLRHEAARRTRDYLSGLGFLEVETPILQPIYGGAAARPFITHHNQLKQDLYLRISFELYLKRLLVGMLDRVYEIGRDFRNEGVSFKHNPEFTQLEFYWAYADYLKVMDLTEEMLRYVSHDVLGTTKITFNGREIDFGKPWRRVELRQGLIDATGIDIDQYTADEALEEAMREKGLKPKPGQPRGKLIDAMIGDYLEPNFIQPTFLYNYPRDISPLAKSKPGNPAVVERFEGFVGGMELCNAFTELNDPLDQEARFLEMGRAYEDDDEERHPMDDDYLRAMRYGMPPNGGFGMGIDRLVMLLTDRRSIREVILFPHLREREE